MPPSTYRDQFKKLINRGYLVQRGESSTFDFYEIPQRVTRTTENNTADDYDFTADAPTAAQTVKNETAKNIEINKNNTNNINTGGEKQASPAPKFYFW